MKPLIISLGHRLRRDDGVGPCVLDALKLTLEARADFIENTGDTAALIDTWRERDRVFLIDACDDHDTSAGQIYRLDGLTENLPEDTPVSSSHALTITNAIELGKLIKALPRSLTIYSIVGKDFSHGEGLSIQVMDAAQQVTARIADEFNIDQLTH